jgi:DNA-directed RNA polymerase subunit beta
VKDSSLKVPPGMKGTVIDVKIFSRIEDQVVEKDRGERIGEVRRIEHEEKNRINEVMLNELARCWPGRLGGADAQGRHRSRSSSPPAPR